MDFLSKKEKKAPESPLEKSLKVRIDELEALILEQSEAMTRLNAAVARINGQKGGDGRGNHRTNGALQSEIYKETPQYTIMKDGKMIPKVQ